MKSLARAVWIVLGVVFAAGSEATAQVAIPSLYNTGVAVHGGLLSEGGGDPNYTLVAVPPGSGFGATPHVAFTYHSPIATGEWLHNGPASQWIAPGSGL